MYNTAYRQLALAVATALLSTTTLGHTTFETPNIVEGTRVLNNVVIGHGCGHGSEPGRVIGTSVVFPQGSDSTIVVDGRVHDGTLNDFVDNWGPNIQPLYSRAVFNEVDEKRDALGNVVGLWAGGGPGVPSNLIAYVPFRVNATLINSDSCAVSVRFRAAIVDVCQITDTASLHQDGVASFWTHNSLGTVYDSADSRDNSASLTIARNLETNPLPASCGAGVEVEVSPSAAQIERDMPIRYQGLQIWPQPASN